MDASIDAIGREYFSTNMNDAISLSNSNNAENNVLITNGIIDILKNEFKDDENIAVKSAILLRLLEVSAPFIFIKCLYVCNPK